MVLCSWTRHRGSDTGGIKGIYEKAYDTKAIKLKRGNITFTKKIKEHEQAKNRHPTNNRPCN